MNTDMKAPFMAGGIPRIVVVVLGAAALVAVAIRYAEPVTDGDIWFHLTYGKYMLERGTLVPDHAAFSWTPADNSQIYCAWIPQVAMYALYKAWGMTSLFALRYLVIASFLAMALVSALPVLRAAPSLTPLVILVCTTGLFMSQAGLLIKAELFSFLFTGVLAFLWFSVKLNRPRSRALLYAIPALMLVWVNSHGAFIFGVLLVACIAAGEALNRVFGTRAQLPGALVTPALAALALCGAALLVTPYGWDYPAYLAHQLSSQATARHFQSVRAYYSILSPEVRGTHLIEYLAVSLVVTGAAAVYAARNRVFDWTSLTVSVPFVLIFFKYMRSTYFWGVLFVFVSINLLRQAAAKPVNFPRYITVAAQAAVMGVVLFFSGRMALESLYSPYVGLNAVHFSDPSDEAKFIRENLQGLTMGNTYNCGSYLMWALWPGHKVFIDERYFPYKDWYERYNEFEWGPDDARRLAFLNAQPCDFWCLPYDFPHLDLFLRSSDWHLLYYGAKASIFVSSRRVTPQAGHAISQGVYDEKGFYTAISAANFARATGDLHVAKRVLLGLEPARLWPGQSRSLASALESLGAAFAKNGRVEDAIEILSRAVTLNPGSAQAHLFFGNALLMAGNSRDAWREYREALRIDPSNIQAQRAASAAPGYRSQAQAANGAARPGDNPEDLARLARSFASAGDYEKALFAFRRLLEIRPGDAETLYNTACVLSRLGRSDEALDMLESAVSHGFDRWDIIRTDPDLAPLRDTPRYHRLVEGR